MSFGAEVVARVLGYGELPTRRLRRAVGGGLLVMAVAMPITFRHGLELYAQREAQQITKRIIDPMLQRLAPSIPATPRAGASAVHH